MTLLTVHDKLPLNEPLEWLLTGSVTQLVLAIIARDTRVTLERWVFDITVNEPSLAGPTACVPIWAASYVTCLAHL
jgi:hypothetical protein